MCVDLAGRQKTSQLLTLSILNISRKTNEQCAMLIGVEAVRSATHMHGMNRAAGSKNLQTVKICLPLPRV